MQGTVLYFKLLSLILIELFVNSLKGGGRGWKLTADQGCVQMFKKGEESQPYRLFFTTQQ